MVPKGYLRPLGAPAAASGEDAAAASEPDEIVAATVPPPVASPDVKRVSESPKPKAGARRPKNAKITYHRRPSGEVERADSYTGRSPNARRPGSRAKLRLRAARGGLLAC